MKFISFVAVFLLAQDYILSEEFSDGPVVDPVCPDTKGETNFVSSKEFTDYYVCEDGEFKGYRVCKDSTVYDAERATCVYVFRTFSYKPLISIDSIVWFIDALINDGRYYREKKAKEAASATMQPSGTTQIPYEQNATKEFTKSLIMQKLTEPESSSSTELNSESTLMEDLSTVVNTHENESTELPAIKSNPSEKLKEFTREFTIPLIQEISDDPKKMTLVASLFRKYFYALLPLATELMEQTQRSGTGIRLPRKLLVEAMSKIKANSTYSLEAASEVLSLVLLKLSNHVELFLDTIEETSKRFQINIYGLLFRSIMFLLKSSNTLYETSTDEFVEFPAMFDIRKDIEVGSKLMTEIINDRMFSETINTASLMFQLFFF